MKVIKDESGQTVVVVAVFLGIVAIGFLALALDVGYLFHERQVVQTAADAAAVAAAEEAANGTSGNEQTVANAVVNLNGLNTTGTNPAVVTFPTPTGNFTGSAYVSVKVSKPVSTFFMGVFSSKFATQTISATATAGGGTLSTTCVCIGGTTGTTLNINGNSHLTTTGCGVVDDSSSTSAVTLSGSGSLNALSLGLSSTSSWTSSNISSWNSDEVTNGGSITLNGVSGGSPVPGVANCAPSVPTAPTYDSTRCVSDPGGSYGTYTWGPAPYAASGSGMGGCYSALTVGANGSTCTLNPGIYVVTGELHFESGANGHSNLGGNGVFFYLPGSASLVIDNGANVNLVAGGSTESAADGGGTATSVGSGYNGIAIYEPSTNTNAIQIQGGSNSYIGGAIYAPGAAFSVGNGSSMTLPIGGIYANSMTMTGGTTLNVTDDVSEGSVMIGGGAPKLVQ
jgi:Flp pilus assembly protein TadG